VYTLREIVDYLVHLLGLRRTIVSLNDRLSWLQAAVLQFAPGKPFSLDNYRSLQVDSVCATGFPGIFEIAPTALESVAPTWLRPMSSAPF
jgi:NADH dehydrogenase